MTATIRLSYSDTVKVEEAGGTMVRLVFCSFGVEVAAKRIDPNAAMALAAAVEAQAKALGGTHKCGRVGMTGHACDMPKGAKCPDCGPCLVDVPEGA